MKALVFRHNLAREAASTIGGRIDQRAFVSRLAPVSHRGRGRASASGRGLGPREHDLLRPVRLRCEADPPERRPRQSADGTGVVPARARPRSRRPPRGHGRARRAQPMAVVRAPRDRPALRGLPGGPLPLVPELPLGRPARRHPHRKLRGSRRSARRALRRAHLAAVRHPRRRLRRGRRAGGSGQRLTALDPARAASSGPGLSWSTARARSRSPRSRCSATSTPHTEVWAATRAGARAALATRLGAHAVLSSSPDELVAQVARRVGTTPLEPWSKRDWLQDGPAVVYDTIGSTETVETSLRLLATGGTLVVSGVEPPKRFEWTPLYFKELRVIGSNGFGIEEVGGVAKHAMEHYFDFVAAGLDLTPVITAPLPARALGRGSAGDQELPAHRCRQGAARTHSRLIPKPRPGRERRFLRRTRYGRAAAVRRTTRELQHRPAIARSRSRIRANPVAPASAQGRGRPVSPVPTVTCR